MEAHIPPTARKKSETALPTAKEKILWNLEGPGSFQKGSHQLFFGVGIRNFFWSSLPRVAFATVWLFASVQGSVIDFFKSLDRHLSTLSFWGMIGCMVFILYPVFINLFRLIFQKNYLFDGKTRAIYFGNQKIANFTDIKFIHIDFTMFSRKIHYGLRIERYQGVPIDLLKSIHKRRALIAAVILRKITAARVKVDGTEWQQK